MHNIVLQSILYYQYHTGGKVTEVRDVHHCMFRLAFILHTVTQHNVLQVLTMHKSVMFSLNVT